MSNFLILIVLIGMLWAVDVFAFGGRYSTAVWQEGNYQAKQLDTEFEIGSKHLAFETTGPFLH
jgi:hypothetical protein